MAGKSSRDDEREPTMADAYEREVQRRVTDWLASAGVKQGIISLSVLYMLPPSFVRSYEKLFLRALREDVTAAGIDETGKARIDPSKRGGRTRQAFGGGAAPGKRYRNHWVIKDEKAMALKDSVDRRLKRLSLEIDRAGNVGNVDRSCESCGENLSVLTDLGVKLRYCPTCGTPLLRKLKEG